MYREVTLCAVLVSAGVGDGFAVEQQRPEADCIPARWPAFAATGAAGAWLGGPPGGLLGVGTALLMGVGRAAQTPRTGPSVRVALAPSASLNGLVLSLPFRTASADMEPHVQAELSQLAALLELHPELHVLVEGHADTRGSRRFNRLLAKRRAAAVAKALLGAGVTPRRLTLASYGEERARYPNGDRDGYAFDRRVVISLVRARAG